MLKNPYKVLGVEINAPIEECKKAYRRLSKKYHPDMGGDEVKFDEINKAWKAIESGEFDLSKFVTKHKHLTHHSLFEFDVVA